MFTPIVHELNLQGKKAGYRDGELRRYLGYKEHVYDLAKTDTVYQIVPQIKVFRQLDLFR